MLTVVATIGADDFPGCHHRQWWQVNIRRASSRLIGADITRATTRAPGPELGHQHARNANSCRRKDAADIFCTLTADPENQPAYSAFPA